MSKKKSKRTREKKTSWSSSQSNKDSLIQKLDIPEIVEVRVEEPPVEVTKIEHTHDQLLSALYFMLDHFSRSNTPWFVTGDTARAIQDGKSLSGDKITVGIRKLDFQDRMMGILEAFNKADEIGEKVIKYNYNGVPIEVQVIDNSEDIFTSLNEVMYSHDFFKLPNPFETYWENRNNYL